VKQYLAQRGQAGGSNVGIPEQSSNPKHSLQKCTLSEWTFDITKNTTTEDSLSRLAVNLKLAILSAVTGQTNAQTDTRTRVSGTYQAAIP